MKGDGMNGDGRNCDGKAGVVTGGLLLAAPVSRRITIPSPLFPSQFMPSPLTWELLLDPEGHPGAYNMALDAALLAEADRSGRAFLRLYRWDPPCLSLGRNEAATRRYDRAALSRLGLDVVRRPTGGRAVWHERELTYAVAAPIAAFGIHQSRRAACRVPIYRVIHARLAAALRALGADATLAPDRLIARPPDRPGPCFAEVVGGEVVVDKKKLVGSAQVHQRAAFLQHGSLLLDGSQEIIGAVSRQPSAVSAGTTLSAVLRRPVSFDEVAEAILRGWPDPVTSTALDRPRPPSTAPFSDPAWTWRR
jgi:lipoyl(octanoyl) transferase